MIILTDNLTINGQTVFSGERISLAMHRELLTEHPEIPGLTAYDACKWDGRTRTFAAQVAAHHAQAEGLS